MQVEYIFQQIVDAFEYLLIGYAVWKSVWKGSESCQRPFSFLKGILRVKAATLQSSSISEMGLREFFYSFLYYSIYT